MEVQVQESGNLKMMSDEEMELRRGPWTAEEDFTLINYIALHGEGRWNSLATSAGLRRNGKSCRLRWLNYLHPDVRRGNITLEEQLLILELHSRWGNKWSKIAQHLPGRTDNEIKNYWRTRVQKHAKQLKCDVNSKQFKDTMRYLWMPRLAERIQASSAAGTSSTTITAPTYHLNNNMGSSQMVVPPQPNMPGNFRFTPENSSTAASSDSFGTHFSPVSDLTDCYNYQVNQSNTQEYYPANELSYEESFTSSAYFNQGLDFQTMEQNNTWMDGGGFWNVDDMWLLLQQFNNNTV